MATESPSSVQKVVIHLGATGYASIVRKSKFKDFVALTVKLVVSYALSMVWGENKQIAMVLMTYAMFKRNSLLPCWFSRESNFWRRSSLVGFVRSS